MPRYFYQVWDRSGQLDDPDGIELPDLFAVRLYAVRAPRSLICDDVSRGVLDLGGRLEVTDMAGNAVMTVRFAEAVKQVISDTAVK